MASTRALAMRRGEVEARLAALADQVNARSATPAPTPTYSKVPDVAALERLEWLAALLDTQAAQLDSHADQVATLTAQLAEAQTQITALTTELLPDESSIPPTDAAPPAVAPKAPRGR